MVEIVRPLSRFAFAPIAAALVCACSVWGPEQVPERVPPNAPASRQPQSLPPLPQQYSPPSLPPPAPRSDRTIVLSPASSALVKQAHAQIAGGDLAAASSTLDRALRIEPDNALLWIELGRLRLAETDPHQAEVCSRKALALGSGNRVAQSQAVRLLVDALRAQGRNQEAHEVESRL